MLPILLACSIWLPAMIGLGSPMARLLRSATGAIVSAVALRAAIAGLLGMFVASTVTSAANFFVPAYPFVSGGLLVIGWILLLRDRRRWLRLPPRAGYTILLVVCLVALADARGLPWYDTGVYHLQAVRWITSGPLPRGLANLYGSLGYNCAWFSFAGAIEAPLLLGKGCFLINALLAILLAMPGADVLIRWRGRPARPYRVVLAIMLYPLAEFGVRGRMISSLAPDLVVMMVILFSTALWVRSPRFAPLAITLACFGVTIKLSAAPFFLAAAAATTVWAIQSRWRIRSVVPVAAFCFGALAICLIRGIWLSGYPAFPAMMGRLGGLGWAASQQTALHVARTIEFWSKYHRVYELVRPGTPWVLHWIRRVGLTEPMVITGVVSIVGIVGWLYRRPHFGVEGFRSAVAILVMLPAIVFWFVAAPQPRFGYGYLFGIASLLIALAFSGIEPRKADLSAWRLGIGGAIFVMLVITGFDLQLLKATWRRWPSIPIATLQPHRTLDGVIVYMPVGDDRVWAAPLPSTPELDSDLRCEVDSKGRFRRFWTSAATGR